MEPERTGAAGGVRSLPTVLFLFLVAGLLLSRPLELSGLTMEEYVDHLRRTHPLFRQSELSVEVAGRRVDELLPDYSQWRFEIEPSYTYAGETQSRELNAEGSHTGALGARVSRDVSTGGSLSFVLESSYTSLLEQQLPGPPPTTEDTEEYRTSVGVEYNQPLVRNLGDRFRRLQGDLARYDVEVARLEAAEQQEQFLLQAAQLYLRWAEAVARQGAWEEQLDLVQRRLQLTQQQREANLVDLADLLQAEQATERAEAALAAVEGEARALRRRIEVILGAESPPVDAPEYELSVLPEIPALETGTEELGPAVGGTRPLAQIDVRIARAREERDRQEKQTLPAVALSGGARIAGANEEISGVVDSPSPELVVAGRISFGASYPGVADTLARVDAQLAQLEAQRQQVYLDLTSGLSETRVRMGSLRTTVERYRRLLETTRRTAAAEEERYNQGRVPLSRLLDAQAAIQEARRSILQTALRYHLALQEHRALTDQLLPEIEL